jgi:hypothetical protein
MTTSSFGSRRAKTPGKGRGAFFTACALLTATCATFAVASPVRAQTQSSPLTTWTVTVVLPPRIVAGQLTTLAALGVDGRLASRVTLDLGNGVRVTTDTTGRGSFTAPASGDFLLAKAAGSSVATLIDPGPHAGGAQAVSAPPVVAIRDRFAICGPGLSGDADANHVYINDQPVLVLAASPECLVVLPRPAAVPGPATISVESSAGQWTAKTTLVALAFDAPVPALAPGKKSSLLLRVRGSDQRLGIVVENQTPGVLRFFRGDAQELLTTGGAQNIAELKVQAIRSGDYSFHAGLLPTQDLPTAIRYLQAAQTVAPEALQNDMKRFASRLAHHPRDFPQVRAELDEILTNTIAGDFRTLAAAARDAL